MNRTRLPLPATEWVDPATFALGALLILVTLGVLAAAILVGLGVNAVFLWLAGLVG